MESRPNANQDAQLRATGVANPRGIQTETFFCCFWRPHVSRCADSVPPLCSRSGQTDGALRAPQVVDVRRTQETSSGGQPREPRQKTSKKQGMCAMFSVCCVDFVCVCVCLWFRCLFFGRCLKMIWEDYLRTVCFCVCCCCCGRCDGF